MANDRVCSSPTTVRSCAPWKVEARPWGAYPLGIVLKMYSTFLNCLQNTKGKPPPPVGCSDLWPDNSASDPQAEAHPPPANSSSRR